MKKFNESSELVSKNLEYYFDDLNSLEDRKIAFGNIIELLNNHKLEFNKLVCLLEPFLTIGNHKHRLKGFEIFNYALKTLGESKIFFQIEPVKNFLINCLKEQIIIPECVEGLNHLLKYHRLENPDVDSTAIVQAIYLNDNVYVQAFPQTIRKYVFELLLRILNEYTSSIEPISNKLVEGFIRAMNGEKDPNSLKLCFNILTKLVLAYQVDKEYEEELYEITSCYFPITLSGKLASTLSIKKSELVIDLRATMVVSQQCWIPFLLSKLLSPILETKLEVLDTFEFALTDKSIRGDNLTLWSVEDITPFLSDMLNILLKEVLFNINDLVVERIFNLITTIVRFLSHFIESNSELLNILKPILYPCLLYLKDDSKKTFYATSTQVFRSIIAGSPGASSLVLALVFPNFENIIKDSNSQQVNYNLFYSLITFADAILLHRNNIQIYPDKNHNKELSSDSQLINSDLINDIPHQILAPYQKFIWSLILSYLHENCSIKELTCALNGLMVMAEVESQKLISVHELVVGIESIVKMLFNLQFEEERTLQILLTLSKIAIVHPEVVLKHGVNLIFDRINQIIESQQNSNLEKESECFSLFKYLRILCNPSSINLTRKSLQLINSIENYFILILQNKFLRFDQLELVISSLANTVSSLEVFMSIIKIILLNYKNSHSDVLRTIRLWLPKLVINLVAASNLDVQFQLLNFNYSLFILRENCLNDNFLMLNFIPLSSTELTEKDPEWIFVPMFSATYASVQLQEFNKEKKKLIEPLILNSVEIICRHICKPFTSFKLDTGCMFENLPKFSYEEDLICAALGSIFNKTELKKTFVNKTIFGLKNSLEKGTNSDSTNYSLTLKITKVIVWIFKALIQTKNSVGRELSIWLLEELLSESNKATAIASFYYIVFAEVPTVLPRYYEDYKEYLWNLIFFPLIESFNKTFVNNSLKLRNIVLLIIFNSTKYLPQKLMFNSSKDILPLFFHGFESKEFEFSSEILNFLYSVILNNPVLVGDRISSIVKVLLKIAKNFNSFFMNDRIKAIECLEKLSGLSYTTLHPIQKTVIEELTSVLDDPKRLVRKEAVKCRNRWYVLGKSS